MNTAAKLILASTLSGALVAGAIANPVSQGGRKFTTELSGAAEVPGPGDPDGSGTAEIILNYGQNRVCYEIELSDVENVVAAHIHVGDSDEAGPVVVGLFSGGFDAEGCISDVDRDLIKEIIQEPDEYYVNVHSSGFPAGAVRGQLSK